MNLIIDHNKALKKWIIPLYCEICHNRGHDYGIGTDFGPVFCENHKKQYDRKEKLKKINGK